MSWRWSARPRVAMILFAACALGIAACNGAGTGGNVFGPSSISRLVRHPVTPPSYTFQTIAPSGDNGDENWVSQMNESNGGSTTGSGSGSGLGRVAAVYANSTSGPYYSYTSTPPYYQDLHLRVDGSASTYLESLTNGTNFDAGWAISPPSSSGKCSTCGVIYDENKGTWSKPLAAPKQGSFPCDVTKILGINDSRLAVGYYLINSGGGCTPQAFEEYPSDSVGDTKFVDLNPTGSSGCPPYSSGKPAATVAYGINGKGDVVGTVVGPTVEGWRYQEMSYNCFVGPGTSITPQGINWNDGVVGQYTDSGGVHGFVTSDIGNLSPTYWPINYNSQPTVVTSLNDHWNISGYYNATHGHYHGFIGICSGCPPPTVAP